MLLKNSFWSLLLSFSQLIFSFIMVPLYIKYLGNLEYSILILSIVLIGFSSVFSFGMGETLLRYIAKYYTSKNINKTKNILESVWFLYIVIGLVWFILLSFFPQLFAFLMKGYENNNNNIFFIIGLIIFLNFFSAVFNITPEALQDYKFIVKVNLIGNFFINIGNYFILINCPNICFILIWQLICNFFIFLNNYIYVCKKLKITPFPKFRIIVLKEIYSYSIFTFFIHLVVFFRVHAETLIITSLLGVKKVVYLDVPRNIISKSAIIIRSIERVFFPKFSTMSLHKDLKKMKNIFINTSLILTSLASMIFIPLTIFFYDFLRLWINENFSNNAYLIGMIIASSFLFSGTNGITLIFLKSLGKVKILSIFEFIISIISIIMTFFLIKFYGLYGVGYSFWVARIINFLLLFYVFYKIFKNSSLDLIKILLVLLFNYFLLGILLYLKLKFNVHINNFFYLIASVSGIIISTGIFNYILLLLLKINILIFLKRKLNE